MCDSYFNVSYLILCSGASAAVSVTQQMTEMSLSCEEKGASGTKVELTEPGSYQIWTCYLSQRICTYTSYTSYTNTLANIPVE